MGLSFVGGLGLVWGAAKGETPERVLALQVPHHLQLYVPLPFLLLLVIHPLTTPTFFFILSPPPRDACSPSRCVSHHTIYSGARTCPKGLNPAAAIAKIKLELAAD